MDDYDLGKCEYCGTIVKKNSDYYCISGTSKENWLGKIIYKSYKSLFRIEWYCKGCGQRNIRYLQ